MYALVKVGDRADWLLRHLGGGFILLTWGEIPTLPDVRTVRVGEDLVDVEGKLAERYAAPLGAAMLFRPDQHVAARFIMPTAPALAAALSCPLGHGSPKGTVP